MVEKKLISGFVFAHAAGFKGSIHAPHKTQEKQKTAACSGGALYCRVLHLFAEICLRRAQTWRFFKLVYFLLILRETGLQHGGLVVY